MKFAKALLSTFMTNILVLGLGMAVGVMTARWLSVSGRGVVSVSSTVVSLLLLVLDLGIGVSNTYFIGKNREDLGAVLGCNLLILIGELALLAPLYFAATCFPQFVAVRFVFKSLTGGVLILTLLTIPVSGFKSALTNIVLGFEQYGSYNRLNIVYQGVDMALVLLFMLVLHFEQTPRAVMAVLLANIAALLAVVFCLSYVLGKRHVRVWFSLSFFKIMSRYAVRAQLGNLVQFATYYFDVLIVNFYISGSVALYSQAVLLANMMWQIPNTVATLMYPAMANAEDPKEIRAVTNRTTRMALLAIFLCCALLAALSRPIILLLFTAKYLGSVLPLLLLLPGVAFFSVSKILASTLAGMGRIDINLKISLVMSAVALTLYFIVIPRFGICGAAVASSVVYILQALLTLHFYRRVNGSGVREVLLMNRSDWRLVKEQAAKRFRRRAA